MFYAMRWAVPSDHFVGSAYEITPTVENYTYKWHDMLNEVILKKIDNTFHLKDCFDDSNNLDV